MRQNLNVFGTVPGPQWPSTLPSVANMYGGLAMDLSLFKGFLYMLVSFPFTIINHL